MAQKVQTLLIDDLDGGQADDTVRFGLDGTDCEIDLSARHTDALRKALHRTSTPHAGHPVLSPGGQAEADAELPVWAHPIP
jgi:hypothetical protein